LIRTISRVLRAERESTKRAKFSRSFDAKVMNYTHGILTLECAYSNFFQPGDAVAAKGVKGFRYLGEVIQSASGRVSVYTKTTQKLEAGSKLTLTNEEPLVSLELQERVADWLTGDTTPDLKITNPLSKSVVFGEAYQPPLTFGALSSPMDVSGRFRLDESQLRAVQAALGLEENELLLIIGPPGTGKTQVIAKIAVELAKRGERVFITSHTNRAVDNAIQLIPNNLALRVGRPEKVQQEIIPYLLGNKAEREAGRMLKQIDQRFRTLLDEEYSVYAKMSTKNGNRELMERLDALKREQMIALEERLSLIRKEGEHLVRSSPIVGCTLVKSQLSPLRDLEADTLIVDEASQVSVPLSLLGMSKSKKWILVGDHKQLLPIFKSVRDAETARSLSVFPSLLSSYPQRSLWLRVHYRSNPAIIDFASNHIYEGKIRAHPSCSERRLRLIGTPAKSYLDSEHPLVFLDVRSRDQMVGSSRMNIAEAKVTARLVRSLMQAGVPKEDIGVITPFRAQKGLLSKYTPTEVDTVDAYQGREKQVIIFSVTATSGMQFVCDENRFTVALTRARQKFMVIANSRALSDHKQCMLKKLYDHCRIKGWVFEERG
jgi:superfamily I DNA and/or RNA helicase